MHFKYFISNYYELPNIVGYSLLLENVKSDSRNLGSLIILKLKPSLNMAKESMPLHLFENDS